jgi:hypothetical protein
MGYFSELDIELKEKNQHIIELVVDLTVAHLACKRALELLTDPDASEFDAHKVENLLRIALSQSKGLPNG